MAVLYPLVKPKFFDSNGDPLSGGFLYVYAAGTTALVTSYSDYQATTPNANPIVLDARGECDIFLSDGSYKFVLADSDNVTIWTRDNITVEDLSSSSTLLSKNTVAYDDASVALAATSATKTIFSLAAKTVIEYIVVKHTTAFSGGSVSALTLDIGDASDADELLASYNLMATVSDTAWESVSVIYLGSFASATNIVATFTATGANLDQLTAGSVDIYVKTKGMN